MDVTAAEKMVLKKMSNSGGNLSLKNMSVREIRALDRLVVKNVVTKFGKGLTIFWKLNDNVILLVV
jgi:hypothetical protein